MERIRLELDLQRAAMAVLACGALVACGASSAEQKSSDGDVAKRFVASLLKNGSARIGVDAKSCLAAATSPVTVSSELAAILGSYIDADWSFAISASCEAGQNAKSQLCRVTFYHQDDNDEASAGFMFLGNPADGSIDTRTLECFHTP